MDKLSYLLLQIPGTSMKWSGGPTIAGMVLLQECSLRTSIPPIPWWEPWESGQCGLTASTSLMLRSHLVDTRWVESEERRENTASRITCKWRQLLLLSRIQHGCELSESHIHKFRLQFYEFNMMTIDFRICRSWMLDICISVINIIHQFWCNLSRLHTLVQENVCCIMITYEWRYIFSLYADCYLVIHR